MDNPKIGEIVGEPMLITVTKEHHVALARHIARVFCENTGLAHGVTFRVATCVSELATNLYFHTTGGGIITLAAVKRGDRNGVRMIAEDTGPGIADVDLAMEDGFSTKGGLGGGLPGVRRMTEEFEIASEVGVGTRVVAIVWRREEDAGRRFRTETAQI